MLKMQEKQGCTIALPFCNFQPTHFIYCHILVDYFRNSRVYHYFATRVYIIYTRSVRAMIQVGWVKQKSARITNRCQEHVHRVRGLAPFNGTFRTNPLPVAGPSLKHLHVDDARSHGGDTFVDAYFLSR